MERSRRAKPLYYLGECHHFAVSWGRRIASSQGPRKPQEPQELPTTPLLFYPFSVSALCVNTTSQLSPLCTARLLSIGSLLRGLNLLLTSPSARIVSFRVWLAGNFGGESRNRSVPFLSRRDENLGKLTDVPFGSFPPSGSEYRIRNGRRIAREFSNGRESVPARTHARRQRSSLRGESVWSTHRERIGPESDHS